LATRSDTSGGAKREEGKEGGREGGREGRRRGYQVGEGKEEDKEMALGREKQNYHTYIDRTPKTIKKRYSLPPSLPRPHLPLPSPPLE